MANLSTADRSSLILALANELKTAKVSRLAGLRIRNRSWAQDVSSRLTDGARVWLNKNLDESYLDGFVRATFARRFLEAEHSFPPRGSKDMRSYEGFGDNLAVAEQIVDELATIPHQYLLVMDGPNEMASSSNAMLPEPLAISAQLSLCTGDQVKQLFELHGAATPFSDFMSPRSKVAEDYNFINDRLYFTYRASGFIAPRTESKLIRDFSDEVRSFYGSAVALDIFDDFFWIEEEAGVAIGCFMLTGGRRMISQHAADPDIVTAAALDASIATYGKAGEDLRLVFDPIKRLFAAKGNSKIKTAAIWVLRAHQSRRPIDRILESTIAIEVLLGDRDASARVGLSRLLANRCAYSLATSVGERKSILDFFEEFYQVRSDIVHSGEHKTSEKARNVVHKGLELAVRVLRHEIGLVTATSDDG